MSAPAWLDPDGDVPAKLAAIGRNAAASPMATVAVIAAGARRRDKMPICSPALCMAAPDCIASDIWCCGHHSPGRPILPTDRAYSTEFAHMVAVLVAIHALSVLAGGPRARPSWHAGSCGLSRHPCLLQGCRVSGANR